MAAPIAQRLRTAIAYSSSASKRTRFVAWPDSSLFSPWASMPAADGSAGGSAEGGADGGADGGGGSSGTLA
jgi:hypothetical protein